MDKTFTLETPATPDRLYPVVRDLGTYSTWIDFVHKVERIPADRTGAAAAEQVDIGGDHPSWWVTLRARLGPLARSKRLRMTRVLDTPPDEHGHGLVRFERDEIDGRDHAQWILEVAIKPGSSADVSIAQCRLAYDGGLWAAPLEPLLDQAAAASSQRLAKVISETPPQ